LSGNGNIHNESREEAYYVASNIPIFLKMLNLFTVSINISPLSSAETIFGQAGNQKIIKFRFAPKVPSFCIHQKCSMGVWSLHILYLLNLNGGFGASPQR